MNLLDSAIRAISPKTAYKRSIYRRSLNNKNASRNKNNNLRRSYFRSPEKDFDFFGNRKDYLNNPYANRAVTLLTSYIIGNGAKPHIQNDSRNLTFKKKEELLKAWADTTKCDRIRELNLYGIQREATKRLILDGQCFVVAFFEKTNNGLPLSLQVLPHSVLVDIKRDKIGRAKQYIFQNSENKETAFDAKYVAHLKDGNSKSWLKSVQKKINDFDIYEEAELIKQQNAACFVGVIRDIEGGIDDGEEEEPQELKPGSLLKAPPGKTVEFANPPQNEGHSAFCKTVLTALGAGLNIPYFLLTGDYSEVNYSSSRMAMQVFYKHISEIQEILIQPKLLDSISEWLEEAYNLSGYAQKSMSIEWVFPKRDLVEPLKDLKAMAYAVEQGFKPHSEIIKEMGEDPEDVYREIEKENILFEKKGFDFGIRRDKEQY